MSTFTFCFLGTGAADWPSLGRESQKGINTSYRRWSSGVLNNKILIDCGPDYFAACKALGCNPNIIDHILITHSHMDHFNPQVIETLCTMRESSRPLHIWADIELRSLLPNHPILQFHGIKVNDTFLLEDIKIKALEANHVVEGSDETCLHYILSKDQKHMFYGCDGAWLLKRTWLEMIHYQFDFMVLDATIGVVSHRGVFEHNNIEMLKLMHLSFINQGILSKKAKVIASHFAISLCPVHEDLQCILKPHGIMTAYDGMNITI